jgi:signal transduction histidine kinase
MGEMAANIAHEIKNPIGSIRLFVDALARDFTNPVAQKNFVEVIPKEVESIDQMIKDLLFLARPPSLNRIALDIRDIAEVTHRFCEEDAVAKNINLQLENAKVPLRVLADGEKLKQALRNIILNAIEAVEPEKGKISTRLFLKDKVATIAISDNGPGIAEENNDRLFIPFFTTKHNGTGLGLAITNRIIEDHGGSILVQSKLGAGTEFIIKLPVISHSSSPT